MADTSYSTRLGEILLRSKVIKADTLASARKEADESGVRIEKFLVEKKFVRPEEMALAVSEYLNMRPFSLAHFTPQTALLDLIPKETLSRRQVIPVARVGKTMTVAVADPFDLMVIDEISTSTGLTITPVVASESDIAKFFARLSSNTSSDLNLEDLMKGDDEDVQMKADEKEDVSLEEVLSSTEAAPVVRIVDMILVDAMRTSANGVHIEPQEKELRLRLRIDGVLMERPSPPKALQNAIISRVKIMSDMDIAETRLPQDGRFSIRAMGRRIDVRVSTMPTTYGEKVVMRLLDKSKLYPNLGALGLDPQAFRAMSHAIQQPHGIMLVTGPTGSGKTTTLYSCVQELNQPNVNIITCEEPVEFQVEGLNQVQVNSDVGLTFAAALRSILRQDPDIVLIGEIRDGETADIAVKAALTGHLVLATLHTNSAAGAITRMMVMGVESFLLVAALLLSQAQRLYRKLCPACRKPERPQKDLLARYRIPEDFFDGSTIYAAVGCPKCNNMGYKGRNAIMEVLALDAELRQIVENGANSSEVTAMAIRKGMVTLKEAGLAKVKEGSTSLKAALDVTGGE